MRYCVSLIYLGYTRNSGCILYDSDTREFLDTTPAEARRLIDCGLIKGIKWRNGEEGPEFVCDTEGFNQQNIPVKSANKFRPYLNDLPGQPINSMYTVVRVLDTDYKGRLFEVVSNKCARIKLEEESLRQLSSLTNIAGVWITDDEIKIADGVMYEDRRPGALFKKGLFKDNQPIPEDPLAAIDLSLLEKKTTEENTQAEDETREADEDDVPAGQETLESLFGNSGTDFSVGEDNVEEAPAEEKEEKPAKSAKKSGKKKK